MIVRIMLVVWVAVIMGIVLFWPIEGHPADPAMRMYFRVHMESAAPDGSTEWWAQSEDNFDRFKTALIRFTDRVVDAGGAIAFQTDYTFILCDEKWGDGEPYLSYLHDVANAGGEVQADEHGHILLLTHGDVAQLLASYGWDTGCIGGAFVNDACLSTSEPTVGVNTGYVYEWSYLDGMASGIGHPNDIATSGIWRFNSMCESEFYEPAANGMIYVGGNGMTPASARDVLDKANSGEITSGLYTASFFMDWRAIYYNADLAIMRQVKTEFAGADNWSWALPPDIIKEWQTIYNSQPTQYLER